VLLSGVNCVVTSDVGPFEIHGGVPNRRIGTRLEFLPPRSINAMDDSHLPYFYRGFRTAQIDLRESRKIGIIGAERRSCFVLADQKPAVVSLRCVRLDGDSPTLLRVRINGADCGTHEVSGNESEVRASAPEAHICQIHQGVWCAGRTSSSKTFQTRQTHHQGGCVMVSNPCRSSTK